LTNDRMIEQCFLVPNAKQRMAEHSTAADRWGTLLDYIAAKIMSQNLRKCLNTGTVLQAKTVFWKRIIQA
jgi:hypothetical protein